jgi:hypothetical protein
MKKLFLLLLAALPAVLFAQDRVINDANAEARNTPSFHAIRVATGIQLIVKQGDADAVAVSASDKETRDRIKTEVVDGELKIYVETKLWGNGAFKYKNLKAYVSVKNIDKFNGVSGSTTTIDGSLAFKELDISLASGARLTGDVKGDYLSVSQHSGAKMYLGGQAQTLLVHTNSGAAFYGYNLTAGKCEVGASSGGKMEINVTRELMAEAISGGKIEYRGGGVITKMSTGSGGTIRKS